MLTKICEQSENFESIPNDIVFTSRLDSNQIEFNNEDYDEIVEEIEFSGSTISISTQMPSSQLKTFRRLFINEMEILLDDLEANESITEPDIIKAKFQDDVQFECDIPGNLLRENSYDWSMNGILLNLNDSSYSVILDKRVNTNKTFMNVSCHFYLNGHHNGLTNLDFPPINLG